MKHCPKCRQTYDDDGDFCVVDGALLASDEGRVFVLQDEDPTGGEIPTQFVAVPHSNVPGSRAADGQKWLYAVIGGLAAIILIGGGYLLATQVREQGTATSNNAARVSPTTDLAAGNVNNVGANSNARYTRIGDGQRGDLGVNTPVNSNVHSYRPPESNMPANRGRREGPLERRFTRTYSGTIDNDSVAMDLVRDGSSLSGKVRPRGRNADIYVEGYIENDGSFGMEEKSDIGLTTGVYRGQISRDGTLTGVWSKPDGGKTRSMFLRRQ